MEQIKKLQCHTVGAPIPLKTFFFEIVCENTLCDFHSQRLETLRPRQNTLLRMYSKFLKNIYWASFRCRKLFRDVGACYVVWIHNMNKSFLSRSRSSNRTNLPEGVNYQGHLYVGEKKFLTVWHNRGWMLTESVTKNYESLLDHGCQFRKRKAVRNVFRYCIIFLYTLEM